MFKRKPHQKPKASQGQIAGALRAYATDDRSAERVEQLLGEGDKSSGGDAQLPLLPEPSFPRSGNDFHDAESDPATRLLRGLLSSTSMDKTVRRS